jgi:GNAT superfamily N-acetyltransferase
MSNQFKDLILRTAMPKDREAILHIEAGATPKLRYLPWVFEEFVSDVEGDFLVAEADGQAAACGKFTLMPDGSAWLETLRVLPEYQGLGIGKRMYERFFKLARKKQVRTMGMYTGVNNAVSKGLAERFGFKTAAAYRGAWLACDAEKPTGHGFKPVIRPERAIELIMPWLDKWTGFLVMNRTFYALTPELCAYLAQNRMVYEDPASSSLVVAGARFMPEQALHSALFAGEAGSCLDFAMHQCHLVGADKVSCLFPPGARDLQDILLSAGYELEASDFIVMRVLV